MNKQNSTVESLKFSPYDSENLLLDNNSNPDENFCFVPFVQCYIQDSTFNSLFTPFAIAVSVIIYRFFSFFQITPKSIG